MKLSGSYELNVEKKVVWQALNDPKVLKQCIPGCDSFNKENDNEFNVIATNKIGPMNATFSGTIAVSNIKINESYTLSGEGQSTVGFAKGSANVKLEEKNGKTFLLYDVDIDVGGKIAQLGSRLIDGVAKKMSGYFFGRFADIVAPLSKKEETGAPTEEVRVKKIKSNFLNKYIYSSFIILILLLVVIFYFVSR
tara:strand:- start:646 stop:1227 length:582 start_codon:yes stop_codon:yes gene_type:complete